MIRRLGRHLIDSFKDLKRNGWMTTAAITSVTITLTLLTLLLAFLFNMNQFTKDVQKNVTVSVFIKTNTTKEEKEVLKQQLKQIPNVDSIKYSSKQNEYKKLIKQNGDLWKGLFTEEDNPLYSVYMVSAKNPRATKKIQVAAKKLDHVAYTTYGGENAEKIIKMADSVKLGGLIAACVLIIVSILLISNTIKLTIIAREDDIKIMRLVGATNGYIRWPFFFEGAWIGLIGSIIPLLILNFGYKIIYNQVQMTLLQAHYQMITPGTMFEYLALVTIVVGVIIGAFGSIISMRRFLKV